MMTQLINSSRRRNQTFLQGVRNVLLASLKDIKEMKHIIASWRLWAADEMSQPFLLMLQSFVNKFINLWKSWFEAKLNLETQAGQVCVSIQLGLGTLHQPPYCRQPGPSRLRRRARRAEAHAAQSADQAADLPVAVEVANTDAAVEAAVPVPPTAEVAVESVPNPPCTVTRV